MRACFIAYKFYESKPRIMQFASALARQGHTVDVLALRREGQANHELVDGVNVYRVQTRVIDEQSRFSYLWRMVRFVCVSAVVLTRKHLSKPYHVVQIETVPEFLVFAAVVPKLLGTPIVLDFYDLLPEFYASKFNSGTGSVVYWMLKGLERLCVAFSDHVLAANDLWYERLVSRSCVPARCTTVCYYPDLRIFSPLCHSKRDDRFIILYAGTLNWHQGLDVAIRAFMEVARRVPRCDFHIYGEGPSKPLLITLALQLGLQERVIFHPMLPASEIAEVMGNSDLALVPKKSSSQFGNEASSTKILDFLALGVPVIAAKTRVEAHYFDDSTIQFFESGNESDLAESIFFLIKNSRRREELRLNGAKYIQGNNWDNKKHAYLDLINSLVAKHKRQIDDASDPRTTVDNVRKDASERIDNSFRG